MGFAGSQISAKQGEQAQIVLDPLRIDRFQLAPGLSRRCAKVTPMPYHVLALTMAQVRQGGLDFQRQLGPVVREAKSLKVYSASPFDLDERRRLKDRFGGDIVYFFNDAAFQESARLGLNLQFRAEIPDTELPRRRTLVVGIPD